MTQPTTQKQSEELLKLLSGNKLPTQEEFKRLVTAIDSHTVLAKVFLLEGTPFVFSQSPMKYVIFREQVAERFNVGYQDVCIVGSAKLGFSPSPTEKYGRSFQETSDVDVVIISEDWFHQGSGELFKQFNFVGPSASSTRGAIKSSKTQQIHIEHKDWADIKDSIRNYVFNNFNPGLLVDDNPLRQQVFEKISSTAGLFLALEPQVFVSKIRCRFFRTWKAAEEYYANSLRLLSRYLGAPEEENEVIEDDAGALLVKPHA